VESPLACVGSFGMLVIHEGLHLLDVGIFVSDHAHKPVLDIGIKVVSRTKSLDSRDHCKDQGAGNDPAADPLNVPSISGGSAQIEPIRLRALPWIGRSSWSGNGFQNLREQERGAR